MFGLFFFSIFGEGWAVLSHWNWDTLIFFFQERGIFFLWTEGYCTTFYPKVYTVYF